MSAKADGRFVGRLAFAPLDKIRLGILALAVRTSLDCAVDYVLAGQHRGVESHALAVKDSRAYGMALNQGVEHGSLVGNAIDVERLEVCQLLGIRKIVALFGKTGIGNRKLLQNIGIGHEVFLVRRQLRNGIDDVHLILDLEGQKIGVHAGKFRKRPVIRKVFDFGIADFQGGTSQQSNGCTSGKKRNLNILHFRPH